MSGYFGGITDIQAIHKAIAAEIAGLAEKVLPANDDLIVIESFADGHAKYKCKLTNLLSAGIGGSVILGVADTLGSGRITIAANEIILEICTSIAPVIYTKVAGFPLP